MSAYEVIDKAAAIAMIFYRRVPVPYLRLMPLKFVAFCAAFWFRRKRRS
jgi:hypothetical protein